MTDRPDLSEKEFQRRVLAALEKTKRSMLLSIINSPAFLWLISVLFLTIGGAYFTSYQQCVRDADGQIELFYKLERETHERHKQIFGAIVATNDLSTLRTKLSSIRPFFPEYQGVSTAIMYEQFLRALARFESDPEAKSIKAVGLDIADVERFNTVPRAELPTNFGEKEIPRLQEYVKKLLAQPFPPEDLRFSNFFDMRRYEPSCRVSTLWRRMWVGSGVPIVRHVTNPFLKRISRPVELGPQ